jgi:hypothetical protein
MNQNNSSIEGTDLVGKHASRLAFLKSRELDEKHYPFIKKLKDDEYTTFRDLVRTVIEQTPHQELQKARIELLEEMAQEFDTNENADYRAWKWANDKLHDIQSELDQHNKSHHESK